jgi:hypothetical protein
MTTYLIEFAAYLILVHSNTSLLTRLNVRSISLSLKYSEASARWRLIRHREWKVCLPQERPCNQWPKLQRAALRPVISWMINTTSATTRRMWMYQATT